jgi:hypothetical protein
METARLGEIGLGCTPRITCLRQFIGTGGECYQHKCKSETKRFQFNTSILSSGDGIFANTAFGPHQCAPRRFARYAHGASEFRSPVRKPFAPLFFAEGEHVHLKKRVS